MKINSSYLAAALLGGMAIASPVSAFSFTPDFTSPNWLSSGDVLRTATTASLSNARNDSSDDVDINNDPVDLNFSGTNPTSGGGPLETFLGISVGDLDTINGEAQEGSAIRQTFDAAAGDILSFNLNIPNFDNTFPDLVFVLFNGSLSTFTSNASVSRTLIAGSNTIAIGVVDIQDSINSSQVVINNVAFTPVPFEFSPAVGIIGLGTIFGLNYLRKKRKSNDQGK